MSSIKKQTTETVQQDEVKARRAIAQDQAHNLKASTRTADQSLLDKSKDLGAKALEAVVDEGRHLGSKVAAVSHKAWDATTGAASKIETAVHNEAQAVGDAVSRGIKNIKQGVMGDDKQAQDKDLPLAKPPQDAPVLHVNRKALDAQLQKLSVTDAAEQERRNRADKEKITADQLHFQLLEGSGCAHSDVPVRSVPMLASDLPQSSPDAPLHTANLEKAAAILGEKLPLAANDAHITQQGNQDMSSGAYNLQPSKPTQSEEEIKEALALPSSVEGSLQQIPSTSSSSSSSSFSAQAPTDPQQFKQGLESTRMWEDIREAAQSVKDRQEEEAEDAKEHDTVHQVKKAVQQAGHKMLETATNMYHAVSDTAAHMLHRDKNKQANSGASSSKVQTRDAHDGAGPKTQGTQAEVQGGNKDKGELIKTHKSEQGEQDRERAMDDGQDALQNIKQQGAQFGEEGKKRKREGEYEPSVDAGAHDQHKVIDARNVKDVNPGEPLQKQARSGSLLQQRGNDEDTVSLEAAQFGTLAECPVPKLDRQHSGSSDTTHIPESNLDKFNQQLKEAKPNEGRMLPASTSEQRVVDHQKPITAPESAITKNGGGDERRSELLSPRALEKSREAHEKHKADGTLPDGKKKTPEEAPRPASEQAEFDPQAKERLEQVKNLEETGATKECLH